MATHFQILTTYYLTNSTFWFKLVRYGNWWDSKCLAIHVLPNIMNNSMEICYEEFIKCETSASLVLRIPIATGEARGNERTPEISNSNTLVSCKEGICFAIKPDEMRFEYFWGLCVLEETLDFKGEKKKKKRCHKEVSAQLSVDFSST